jgi:hypothetical protein
MEDQFTIAFDTSSSAMEMARPGVKRGMEAKPD